MEDRSMALCKTAVTAVLHWAIDIFMNEYSLETDHMENMHGLSNLWAHQFFMVFQHNFSMYG